MNRAIPDEIVEEIRTRSNIIEVIGAVLPLKRAGAGTYKGLCPFHQEKTPSFTVNETRQSFHCFGCGKGGDIFRFVMERENVDFPNAIYLLASRCGVIIPERAETPQRREESKKRADERERLYQLNEDICTFFQRQLKENANQSASEYLDKRGVPASIRERFRLGYSPEDWDSTVKYVRSIGYSESEMVASGVIGRSESGRLYDRFRGRLTFAIWNEQSKVVGFSARILVPNEQTGKYVNTPETPIFHKGNLLYALPFARQAMGKMEMAILCEGQLDTIAMHRAGYECAVAPQGTAFTEEQALILKRYTDKALLAFDSDGAGQKAAFKAIQILISLDFEVKIVNIPGGKDPDELYTNGGELAVKTIVESATDWMDFLVAAMQKVFDVSTPGGATRAVSAVVNYLKLIKNPVTLELYIRRGARLMAVSETALTAELNRAARQDSRRFAGAANAQPAAKVSAVVNQIEKIEEAMLEMALNNAEIARKMADLLSQNAISDTQVGRALNIVLGCAINGEHEASCALINEMLCEEPSEIISELMVKDFSYPEARLNKALEDCLRAHEYEREKNATKMLTKEVNSVDDLRKLLQIRQGK